MDNIETRSDISYGPLELDEHKLDLHVPPAARARTADPLFPLVVFVHGGAWRSEDKAEHAQLAKRIALRTGCTVAVPNYRLSPRSLDHSPGESAVYHPQHAQDVLSALTFLSPVPEPDPDSESDDDDDDNNNKPSVTRIAPYDAKRLFLIGHSCGAHILSCIFLDSSASAPPLTPPPNLLAAVLGIAFSEGIYDIDLLLSSFPSYRGFIAGAFGERASYDEYNVTKYQLREGGERIHWLVVHSSGDTLVDFKQSEAMYSHLKALEVHSKHGDTVLKDFTTITSEHNDMLKTIQYSDLIGNWINSLHFH